MSTNLYELLAVPWNASKDRLRTRYREIKQMVLADMVEPDAADRMGRAYSVLMNSAERDAYHKLYQLSTDASVLPVGPAAGEDDRLADAILPVEPGDGPVVSLPAKTPRTRNRQTYKMKLQLLREWEHYINPADPHKVSTPVDSRIMMAAFDKQLSGGSLTKWNKRCMAEKWWLWTKKELNLRHTNAEIVRKYT